MYFDRMNKYHEFAKVEDIEDIMTKEKPNFKLHDDCKKKSIVSYSKLVYA